MRASSFVASAVATFVLLAPAAAGAEDPKAAGFEPAFDETLGEAPWSSGWVPGGFSPLNVKIDASIGDRLIIDMDGEGIYDWDTQQLRLVGMEDGGDFSYGLIIGFGAGVQLTFPISIESDLIGPAELPVPVSETFDPYLLVGNADRPIETGIQIGPIDVLTQSLDFGPVTGTINIAVQVNLAAVTFETERIDFALSEGGEAIASMTIEGDPIDLALDEPAEGESAELWGTVFGTLDVDAEIIFLPTVVVEALGQEFEIGPFDLPIEFPISNQTIEFPPALMAFEGPTPEPDPEPEPTDTDDGEESDDMGETEDDGGEGETDDDGRTDTDTGTGDGPGQDLDDGCGCASDPGPGGFAMTILGLLGLGFALRRRDD